MTSHFRHGDCAFIREQQFRACNHSLTRIISLPGLGPKSAKMLADIGILGISDLLAIGPVQAFIKVRDKNRYQPSLNLLYAIASALENRNWLDVVCVKICYRF
ncbi:MAG: TfoX/Sxy family DNA transformation protein [Granulosicoccus sp.]